MYLSPDQSAPPVVRSESLTDMVAHDPWPAALGTRFRGTFNSFCAVSLNIGLRATTSLRGKARKVELAVYSEAKKLSETRG